MKSCTLNIRESIPLDSDIAQKLSYGHSSVPQIRYILKHMCYSSNIHVKIHKDLPCSQDESILIIPNVGGSTKTDFLSCFGE